MGHGCVRPEEEEEEEVHTLHFPLRRCFSSRKLKERLQLAREGGGQRRDLGFAN